jgi:hypothetical protein
MCPNAGDAALHCTSAADCAQSQVCCFIQQNNVTSECRTQCGGGDQQLCDPNAQNPGCPQGQQCQSANGGDQGLPNGVGICGG